MQGKNLNANSRAERPARLEDASRDRICCDPKVKEPGSTMRRRWFRASDSLKVWHIYVCKKDLVEYWVSGFQGLVLSDSWSNPKIEVNSLLGLGPCRNDRQSIQ